MLRLSTAIIALGSLFLSPRAISASTPQAAEPADQVKGFYGAYVSGDVDAARAYWTPEGAEIFDRTFSRPMRVRCMALHHLTVRVSRPQAATAVAEVVALVSSSSTLPGDEARFETIRSTISLVEVGSVWRIAKWSFREEALYPELLRAGSGWRELVRREVDEGIRGHVLVRELTRQGIDHFNRHDLKTAWRVGSLAAEVAEELDDDAARSEALGALSILHEDDGEEALKLATRSLALAETTHDPYVIARGLQHRGRALIAATGQTPREPFERILHLADAIPVQATLANAATRLADHFNEEGDRRNALRAALQTLQYAKAAGRTEQLISAHQSLGAAYLSSGDAELALPHWKAAIELTRENGFREALSFSLCMLAETESRLGRAADAHSSVSEALSIAESLESRLLLEVLIARARLMMRSGEAECAEADLNRVISSADHGSSKSHLALAFGMLSSLRLNAGDAPTALRYALISQAIAEDGGLQRGSLEAALAFRRLGKLDDAAAELVRYLPTVRMNVERAVPDPRLFWTLRQSLAAAETELADILVDLGKPAEALIVGEQRRAQTLRTFGRSHARRRSKPTAEFTRAASHVSALNRSLALASDDDEPALREELDKSRRDLAAIQASEAALDETRTVANLDRLDLASLRLPARTTAVEYVIARERVIAFTITARPNGRPEVRATSLPVDLAALSRDIDRLLGLIERRDPRFQFLVARLYEALVRPVETRLTASEFLCILPDGILWKVPFHILRDAHHRYLGDRICVYYSPSLRFLARETGGPAAPATLDFVGLANADFNRLTALPDAEAEVRAIAAMYDPRTSRLFTGSRAVEAVLKAEGSRARILHIASHAILDDRAPMYSYLVLTPSGDGDDDGLLEAREVAELSLHAEVAILSACDTARGEIGAGEGVMGLSFAFLMAGVRTTVVSQWKADSEAARKVMIEFHRALSAGIPPPKAMQKAQQRLHHDPRYAHPYDWAPFILLGAF